MSRKAIPRIERICLFCGITVLAKQADVIRGYGNYCSHRCSGKATAGKPKPRNAGPLSALWRGGYNAEKINARQRAARKAHPEKSRARDAVKYALRTGRLVKGECQGVGEHHGPIQAHHPNYSKPLDVMWLCYRHHDLEHDQNRPRGDKHWHSNENQANKRNSPNTGDNL